MIHLHNRKCVKKAQGLRLTWAHTQTGDRTMALAVASENPFCLSLDILAVFSQFHDAITNKSYVTPAREHSLSHFSFFGVRR